MFSLSWFTTIPGLLITGGVLLLVIALVIFIVTSRKDKNKNDNAGGTTPVNNTVAVPNINANANVAPLPVTEGNVQVPVTPVVQPEVAVSMPEQPAITQPMPVEMPTEINGQVAMPEASVNAFAVPDVPATPVESPQTADTNMQEQMVVNAPVEMPTNIYSTDTPVPSVEQVVPEMPVNTTTVDAPEMPTVSNVGEVIVNTPPMVQPQIEEVPIVQAPVTEQVATVPIDTPVPSVEQVVPEMQDVTAPTISAPESVSIPTEVQYSVPVDNTQPSSIYGGVSPVIPSAEVITPPVQEHQIYGGANPLESTQSVPIAEIANEINNVNTTPQASEVQVTPNVAMPEQPGVVPTPEVEPNQTVYQAQQSNTAPSSAYIPEQSAPINNNFAYQTAPVQQPVMPNNMPQ